MNITLAQAEKAIAVAKQKAIAIDKKVNIVIVDVEVNLVAFARMDFSWLGSLDISIKKVKTARFFDFNTVIIGELSQPGVSLYSFEHSNNGLITFPGGIPIKNAQS
ncbi:MAG: heme-binding protein [Methylotenera sp.]|nr:heme-binding protein [Flavobacterium sp.]